jgi:F-type H+-transporting ATPase subunit a
VPSRPPDPFKAPGLELFKPPSLFTFDLFGVHFEVNRVVLYMFLASLIVMGLFLYAASRRSLVPRGFVPNFVDSVVTFIREQIALQVIGKEGLPWVPFLTSLFMFILVANIFEVIPGIQFPVTSRIAVPLFLSGLVWILFNAAGIRAQGVGGYLRSVLFPPGVPWPIYFLLTPIEFFSVFVIRPATLAIRLFANMVAGHLILAIFFLGTGYLLAKASTAAFGVASFALGTAMIGFELLVAVLQAYIFTILTAVYVAGAIHPEH